MDKIICFGKNYLEHAKELGDAVPDQPVLFLKPPSCLKEWRSGKRHSEVLSVSLPKEYGEVHHECEIVVKIKVGSKCMNLTREEAAQTIESVGVGLDLTLRELQSKLKKASHPWTISKVFQNAAVVSPLVEVSEFQDWRDALFSFSLNGNLKQKATSREMSFDVESLIMQASKHFELCDGDLLFTGTPAGVSKVASGDQASLKFAEREFFLRFE